MVGSVSGLKCSSIYCSTSSMPICFPLPIDHTELNCSPFITADSRMNTAVAPDPLMKSTPFGFSCGMGLVNTLWWWLLSSPMQFGPMSAALCFLQVSSMSSSSRAPSSVSSPNPADIMMKAFTFFSSARIFTVCGHICAGITSTASSVSGSSLMS